MSFSRFVFWPAFGWPRRLQVGLKRSPKGFREPSQNGVPKMCPKIVIFGTPECASSVVNNSKIYYFHVWILIPCWVPFWRSFGSPNGGKSHQKTISKKRQKLRLNMSPTWSPRGSQNGAKIVKIEVFEAPGFQRGRQVASRTLLGSILRGCWDRCRGRQRVPEPPQGFPF